MDVAIKQLKNIDETRMTGRRAKEGFEKARIEFFKECNILRILHHPHLVQVRYVKWLIFFIKQYLFYSFFVWIPSLLYIISHSSGLCYMYT